MSDRIDELVAAIDANTLLQWDGKDVALEAAYELATIARKAEAERDALLAEHEAWMAWRTGKPSTSRKDWNRLTNAHHNAERVIRGE